MPTPHLRRAREFIPKAENIVFIGPTGLGKTGLASALLLKALQNGHRGIFMRAQDLFDEMYASLADRSTHTPSGPTSSATRSSSMLSSATSATSATPPKSTAPASVTPLADHHRPLRNRPRRSPRALDLLPVVGASVLSAASLVAGGPLLSLLVGVPSLMHRSTNTTAIAISARPGSHERRWVTSRER